MWQFEPPKREKPLMVAVDSGMIRAVGHDCERQELFIDFHANPEFYVYYGVGREVYEGLMLSDSKGRYFNENIQPVYTRYDRFPSPSP